MTPLLAQADRRAEAIAYHNLWGTVSIAPWGKKIKRTWMRSKSSLLLVRPAGFEPAAFSSGGWRSIFLTLSTCLKIYRVKDIFNKYSSTVFLPKRAQPSLRKTCLMVNRQVRFVQKKFEPLILAWHRIYLLSPLPCSDLFPQK